MDERIVKAAAAGADETMVLRRGGERKLAEWQRRSAMGHWRIMREVLPDGVWVNW